MVGNKSSQRSFQKVLWLNTRTYNTYILCRWPKNKCLDARKSICYPICFSIKFLIRNISWGKCWLCVWADWAPSLSGLSSPPVSASLFTEPFSLQTTVARASHPHTYLPTSEHPIILLRINSSSPRKVLQLHHIPFPTKLPSFVSNDPITWEIWSAENAFLLLSPSLTKSYHEDSKQFLAPEIETEFALTIVL